jgi:hypothetical protein
MVATHLPMRDAKQSVSQSPAMLLATCSVAPVEPPGVRPIDRCRGPTRVCTLRFVATTDLGFYVPPKLPYRVCEDLVLPHLGARMEHGNGLMAASILWAEE